MEEEKFGYLGTDEELTTRPKKDDFEKNVLGGCVVFSLASTVQLAAVAIPLLLERDLHTYGQLYNVLIIYIVVGVVAGVAVTLLGGLAGLCGSLAGLVPSATFLWLRISDKVSGVVGLDGMEPAEYPEAYAWLVPATVCTALAAVFVVTFYLKRLLSRNSAS